MRELSLHILDIAQNSISAGAALIKISVDEDVQSDSLTLCIADNGRGMTAEQAARVSDPFYTTRTTRKVGLGVPLFRMAAEMTGGDFSVKSQPGLGTTVTARFVTSSIDMIPLGEINSTVSLLIRCNPEIDFIFRRSLNGNSFTLDTRELKQTLGPQVPLDTQEVMEWIEGYLAEQTQIIIGGAS